MRLGKINILGFPFLLKMRYLIILTYIYGLAIAFPIFSSFFSVLNSDPRLIKLGPDEFMIVDGDKEKLALKRKDVKFIDVTNQISIEEAYERGLVLKPSMSFLDKILLMGSKQVTVLEKPVPVYNYPSSAEYSVIVKDLFKNIDIEFMTSMLGKFTSFYTRYYKSESGFQSANWLYQTIENHTEGIPQVSITKFHHKEWDQFSIIVSIPGEVGDKVILGAHQDSANLLFPNLMKAPGADDDGSGTVTILETLRILLHEYKNNRFIPHNTLEFHFYSAEEGGLLGSIDVFTEYLKNNEIVLGMLQQDMTGSTSRTKDAGVEPHMGLIEDHTSINLNNFLKMIINEYNNITYHETECGYACSDHSSALECGYPSSFIIESEFKYSSRYIHSVLDTIDRIDWEHVREHVKLSIAYIFELGLALKLHDSN